MLPHCLLPEKEEVLRRAPGEVVELQTSLSENAQLWELRVQMLGLPRTRLPVEVEELVRGPAKETRKVAGQLLRDYPLHPKSTSVAG
jgi:hypothetical protein